MADTKILKARCHCKNVHLTVTVPLASLPLPVFLCHCSMCRYRSGAPCVFHTHIEKQWPVEFIAPSVEANISQYDSSDAMSSWHFCSTCGCHVGSKLYSDGSWVISTSIFVPSDQEKDNFLITKHKHSTSTRDGGLAGCMEKFMGRRQTDEPEDHDRRIIDWNPDEEHVDTDVAPESEASGKDRLRAQCHCGGVSFTIGRPTEEHIEDAFHQHYISPLDKSKWLATWDVCNDCRLVNGNHVIGWTFAPVSAIEPAVKSLEIGTSKTYASSPGVTRTFCGTCGATVFFSCDERTPTEDTQVVDIATGLLRAPEGVMSTDWLDWRPRLAHAASGDSYDHEFWKSLDAGMRRWTSNQYGEESAQKLDRDI